MDVQQQKINDKLCETITIANDCFDLIQTQQECRLVRKTEWKQNEVWTL